MNKRENLEKMVIATLDSHGTLSAAQIYNSIAKTNPKALTEEKVRNINSLSKVMRAFSDVSKTEQHGVYALKKNL